MSTNLPTPTQGTPIVRIFGAGDTGLNVIQLLMADGLAAELFAALNTGGTSLEHSTAAQRIRLENQRLRGLGSGGDPERARQAAEEKIEELKALCAGVDVVFILAGLGGGAGTGISPVLARTAKAAGSLVLAFVTTPFDCEGTRRQALAEHGLQELCEAVDGLICLPNQKIFKLIEKNTSVVDTFKLANRLLADGVLGIWRLLTFKGLIEVHREELCQLLQEHPCESTFAVAEAHGPERASRAMEKLMVHALLDEGEALANSRAVLVSLTGGPDLTMADVNCVMAEFKTKCPAAEVLMGACIDPSFEDRLAVTAIVTSKPETTHAPRTRTEELDTQLLDRTATAKPNSRFLPPPPALPPHEVQKLLSRQARGQSAVRKASARLRQTQLPLEIISKGRFDKSEPTIHKGEDLDVPTYIRRGVPLN